MITLPSEKELIELLSKECETFCLEEGGITTLSLFYHRLTYHIAGQVIQEVVKINYPYLFNQKHHDNTESK